MNVQKEQRAAREYLRSEFVNNKGLKINGTFYTDLESFRNGDKTAYKSLIDVLIWGDKISYDSIVWPERLQSK